MTKDNAETQPSSSTGSQAGDESIPTWSKKWTGFLLTIRKPIKNSLLFVSTKAATYPKSFVVGVIGFSIAIAVLGLFTNFNVDVDEDVLWTPSGSRPVSHGSWIDDESGFPELPRVANLLVHAEGDNLLGQESIGRTFEALDAFRSTAGYEELCALHESEQCTIKSVTQFWNNSYDIFTAQISSDEEAILAMSASTFPDGTPVDHKAIIGKPEFDADGVLTSGELLSTTIDLPSAEDGDPAESFEDKALDVVLGLQSQWDNEEGNIFSLEVTVERSFADEFTRAITNDLPLVPAVFVTMAIFTCIVFFKRDWVKSRSLLGFGAVVGVLLSLLSGFGLMFLIGVPFTSMTQILPFVLFGIGLDDAFIISGEYARTDTKKSAVERVHDTIDEVGVSIFVTTLTSVTAFALGTTSTIPAVYWLCQYAIPTLIFDFIFQITFFVALIVIDEKRVQEQRRDWLFCFAAPNRETQTEIVAADKPLADRVMLWYANKLLRPWVKALVLIVFAGLLGGLAYSATKFEESFNFKDVLPSDSYLQGYFNSIEDYSSRSGVAPDVYFRFVDQGDPEIQAAMESYVNDLVNGLQEVSDQPTEFWLRDFVSYVEASETLQGLTFKEQIASFLSEKTFFDQYSENMVLNANGDLTASRVTIFMENISAEDVTDQINALKNQRRITAAQPINQGKSDWDFFTFDGTYYIWEFFSVVSDELLLTAILGVVAVSVISFLFIPHWSAVLFVLPIITILYVELMGFLQICGASINPVSYISLVMAIGLLVDFLVHTVLKYFESTEKGDDAKATRDAKTTDMLCTMGASLLIGGISTALGVVPLAFSTSEIFSTVFITFIGLVLLGLSHGLVLLPVLLSLVGPTVSISSIKGPPSEIKTADRQETALSLEDIASDDTSAVNEKPELVVEELDPEFDV